ncbi:transcriptional regulator [Desulfocurvus sp. DL9XJH121]
MLFKLLLAAVAIFFLVKLFKGDARKKEAQSAKERDKLIASGEMVKDPVCGTFVEKDTSIRVREGEKVHCFCSYECRDKFLNQLEAGQDD